MEPGSEAAQRAIAGHFRDTGPMTSEPWAKVGQAVRNQRLHLGWTQQDAAEHAGVSLATWRLIEAGGRDRYQELTIRGVCRAFGWPTDAFAVILGGGDPPELVDLESTGAAKATATATAATPAERPARDDRPLPVGFARKYLELTHTEQAMVEGYLEALLDRRARG
jgi:DNA-binding XRE family transcriptional regulator